MEINEYGVIVCPRCRVARGIRLNQKTARCPKCGKAWKIRKLRIVCKARDARELQEAVAMINMKLGKNPKGYL